MAITLQTVLPQKVLPRAPSPNSSSPNPGIRSAITQFIPASPNASLEADSLSTPVAESSSNGPIHPNSNGMNHAHALSGSSQTPSDGGSTHPALNNKSVVTLASRKSISAEAGSRRNIAHSSRVLGRDKNAEDTFALSRLTSGKVDVSFEATLNGQHPLSPSRNKGKGRARDGEDGDNEAAALFDVDLESGQPSPSGGPRSSRAGKLLQLGAQSMPWSKSKSNTATPAMESITAPSSTKIHEAPVSTSAVDSRDDSLDFGRPLKPIHDGTADYSADEKLDDGDDYHEGLGAFDDDRQQLLYGGVDGEERPNYFAPGDRNFAYNSLDASTGMGGYGSAVGFEAVTMREGGWMILSSILVGVLVTVAIMISVDVIDWPGDGIGSN